MKKLNLEEKMDQQKYYWIKLKTDFFNQGAMDFLLSQPNGCEYVVLYQMLCLSTANNDGLMALRVGEMIIPYNVDKIVRDTKYFDRDTVLVALELFKKLGLVYEEEEGVLKIAEVGCLVGSESASREALKKRQQRLKQKNGDKSGDKMSPKVGTKCPTDIDIDIEYRIKKNTKKKSGSLDDILNEKIEDAQLRQAFSEFIEMRKVMKAPLTAYGLKLAISKANKLSNGNPELARAIVEQSIERSWKGLFSIEDDEKNQRKVVDFS